MTRSFRTLCREGLGSQFSAPKYGRNRYPAIQAEVGPSDRIRHLPLLHGVFSQTDQHKLKSFRSSACAFTSKARKPAVQVAKLGEPCEYLSRRSAWMNLKVQWLLALVWKRPGMVPAQARLHCLVGSFAESKGCNCQVAQLSVAPVTVRLLHAEPGSRMPRKVQKRWLAASGGSWSLRSFEMDFPTWGEAETSPHKQCPKEVE